MTNPCKDKYLHGQEIDTHYLKKVNFNKKV